MHFEFRMITADPIDKLVNSTTDYPTSSSTAEHLSLSQGYGHSQHNSQGGTCVYLYTNK